MADVTLPVLSFTKPASVSSYLGMSGFSRICADIAHCEEDFQVTANSAVPSATPDDPLYPEQWALDSTNAAEVWATGNFGSRNVKVCMVRGLAPVMSPKIQQALHSIFARTQSICFAGTGAADSACADLCRCILEAGTACVLPNTSLSWNPRSCLHLVMHLLQQRLPQHELNAAHDHLRPPLCTDMMQLLQKQAVQP